MSEKEEILRKDEKILGEFHFRKEFQEKEIKFPFPFGYEDRGRKKIFGRILLDNRLSNIRAET